MTSSCHDEVALPMRGGRTSSANILVKRTSPSSFHAAALPRAILPQLETPEKPAVPPQPPPRTTQLSPNANPYTAGSQT